MFGMHLAGRDRATVTDMEGLRFAPTGHRDLATYHHDARVPVMRVVGVHLTRFQATIEDLVTFTPEIGFEIALVHDKPRVLMGRYSAAGLRRPAMQVVPAAAGLLKRFHSAPITA